VPDLLEYERKIWSTGIVSLAGIDEAGRGPLAGPVSAAAVIIPRELAEREQALLLRDINDSKKLTPSKREKLFIILAGNAGIQYGVGLASASEIDKINILRATYMAMARAVSALPSMPEHALVDGLPVEGLPCASTAIVQGDAKSLLIAAASIVAKVTRDRIMDELHKKYPVYGFIKHKGYGTKQHMQALFEHGPCPEHRLSFRPVAEAAAIFAKK
jgi:ribonuclease HII